MKQLVIATSFLQIVSTELRREGRVSIRETASNVTLSIPHSEKLNSLLSSKNTPQILLILSSNALGCPFRSTVLSYISFNFLMLSASTILSRSLFDPSRAISSLTCDSSDSNTASEYSNDFV